MVKKMGVKESIYDPYPIPSCYYTIKKLSERKCGRCGSTTFKENIVLLKSSEHKYNCWICINPSCKDVVGE